MTFTSSHRIALTLVSGAGAIVLPMTSAAAQEVDGGVYVRGGVGITLPSDFDLDGIQAPEGLSPGVAGAPANVDIDLDSDVTLSGAIGYQLPTVLFGAIQPSFELEYTYASPGVDGGSFNGGDQTFGGEVDVQTFTVNYQADIIHSDNQRLTPFFGGGIGIADVDSSVAYFPATATAPTFTVADDDTAFVYQGDIGLRYDVTDAIALDARARYQRVDGVDLERRFIGGGANDFSSDLSGDYETVSFVAGVRYNF
ncbi:outer membrane beta-barrel protein [uncultured Erythrobacter sp.]|uniref:outer membrane protein n=1 Tax=uncultured Erythrobacter sp. TaxID=263913 RepID=UPI0026308507|nr:outer membrane beta-barrel protein [uncultured Erythrobacter sp.]